MSPDPATAPVRPRHSQTLRNHRWKKPLQSGPWSESRISAAREEKSAGCGVIPASASIMGLTNNSKSHHGRHRLPGSPKKYRLFGADTPFDAGGDLLRARGRGRLRHMNRIRPAGPAESPLRKIEFRLQPCQRLLTRSYFPMETPPVSNRRSHCNPSSINARSRRGSSGAIASRTASPPAACTCAASEYEFEFRIWPGPALRQSLQSRRQSRESQRAACGRPARDSGPPKPQLQSCVIQSPPRSSSSSPARASAPRGTKFSAALTLR